MIPIKAQFTIITYSQIKIYDQIDVKKQLSIRTIDELPASRMFVESNSVHHFLFCEKFGDIVKSGFIQTPISY